jgi:integral membrane protein
VLRFFRYIALIEGITTLALFLIAMPMKYWFGNPILIRPTGMIHGAAFLAYIGVMVLVLPGKGFGVLGWLRTAAASFFPFGTFLNDPFLKRKEAELEASARA